jgi:hypothetical protein
MKCLGISRMFYEYDIGQILKVFIARYNPVISDSCSCKNYGISDAAQKSFTLIPPGQDSDFPAYRYDQTSDSHLTNNILNGSGILLLAEKFYHFCQSEHGSEEIRSVSLDVIFYFRNMTVIIFNPDPGINEVPDTDPPPRVQKIQ